MHLGLASHTAMMIGVILYTFGAEWPHTCDGRTEVCEWETFVLLTYILSECNRIFRSSEVRVFAILHFKFYAYYNMHIILLKTIVHVFIYLHQTTALPF